MAATTSITSKAREAEAMRLRTIFETIEALPSSDEMSQEEDYREVAGSLGVPYLFLLIADHIRVTVEDVLELTRNTAAMQVVREMATRDEAESAEKVA